MQCKHCGTQWPDELAGKLKFCGACGKPLQDEPAVIPTAPPATKDQTNPGGELRFMTVLFADLAGFTAFAENRSPDEVAAIVGDLLQRLGAVVAQYNGAVDKFLGDAVVATFGLPKPDPNAARNAVRAGLAMQEETERFNLEKNFNFGLRVGIHAGEAMFRAIGGAWTVMGDTVNTASRIQSTAAAGQVWISQPVYEEVRRHFSLSLRPAVELRGRKQTIQPYQVLSERATPMIELPPFVGRETEWQELMKNISECIQQQALKTLFLRGAAGVGKSRITWELREWAQRQEQLFRLDVIQYDHSERMPSHGLNSLIRNRFHLPLELNDETILKKLAEQIPVEYPTLPAERQAVAVELFAFVLGIQRPDFHIASLDGPAKWSNAFFEIKNWLESQADKEEPWLIIIEDAQKGDADTAAFLDWATRVQWNAPIFILVTAREEDFGPECYWHTPLTTWVQEGLVREIRLREIEPQTLASALLALSGDEMSESLALRIAEHTEGNPLFATEIVLLLKEHQSQQESPETLPLPGSIREVMEARIERLGVAGKEVAKRGALMGRRFTMEAVGRIWDRPMNEMNNGIRVLYESETVYQEVSKLFTGEMEEVFRHGRLQEAALARIPRDERIKWLTGLEEWAKGKLESFGEYWEGVGILLVPLIARSRIEQNDQIEASLWYEALGWLHMKHHRNQEAAAAFRNAHPSASGVRRLVLARQVAELDIYSGHTSRAEQFIEAELASPTQSRQAQVMFPIIRQLIGDRLARWDLLDSTTARLALECTRGDLYSRLGKIQQAETVFKTVGESIDRLRGVAADLLRLRWANQWGYCLAENLANPQAAQELYARLREEVDLNAQALQSERIAMLGTEFNIEMRLGRYDKAKSLADELLKVAQANQNTRQEARAWNSSGITEQSLGNWREAANCYDQALRLARAIGERRLEAIALHNLGIIRMDQARYDEALTCQQEYLELSRTIGNHMAESYAPAYMGMIHMAQGRFEDAQNMLDQSIQLAESKGWPRLVGLNLALQATLKLYSWLSIGGQELEECCTEFEASEEQWKMLDEAGEFYAAFAIATFRKGGSKPASAILERARNNVDQSWVAARIMLDLADAILNEQTLDHFFTWFNEHDFQRGIGFTELATGKTRQG